MAILIEQTQAEMQSSHSLSCRAEIVGVKVISASFSAPKPLPTELEESLAVGIRFAPQEAPVAEGCVRAATFFECIITESEEADEQEPIAKFECSLLATYHLQDGYVPSESEVAAFHKANVIFNCWPYFREFIQSSACRMNIPPPPVPFVKVHIVQNDFSVPVPLVPKKRSKKVLKAPKA